MAYRNGSPSNDAANIPFKVKNGLAYRGEFDEALPNTYPQYVNNAANTGMLHYLIAADANNQTELRNAYGTLVFGGITYFMMATPGVPVITTAGTAGSTAYTYKIVAYNGFGATLANTPASAGGATATGNATLTTTNYNIVTFPAVTGAALYAVYRTASSGTPSSTGLIGYVFASVSAGISRYGLQPLTYAFNDTGIAGDSTTPPTTNTSGGATQTFALATPGGVTATPKGTVGATTDAYKIVAVAANGTTTAASSAGTSTTSNATLSTTNFNQVAWNPVPGAVSYIVYRTTAAGTPSTTGVIGTVLSSAFALGAVLTFNDTGLVADGSTAPTTNTTGGTFATTLSNTQIPTPTVTATVNGAAGATTITYKLVANGTLGTTAASAAATVTTGNATLSATNSITLNWNPVTGAVSYTLYRTAAGGTPNSVGILTGATALGPNVLTFTDTGLTGDTTTPPTVNTTGQLITAITDNFIFTETGANNAIIGALLDATGAAVALVNGVQVTVRLAHSLQAGANTFNFNGNGTKAIKQNTNPATDIATAYVSGGSITLLYDGTVWQEMS